MWRYSGKTPIIAHLKLGLDLDLIILRSAFQEQDLNKKNQATNNIILHNKTFNNLSYLNADLVEVLRKVT